jgi:hypothetical protein
LRAIPVAVTDSHPTHIRTDAPHTTHRGCQKSFAKRLVGQLEGQQRQTSKKKTRAGGALHALWHPRPVLLVETKNALLGQSGPNFLSSCTPFFFLWLMLTDAGSFFAMSNRSCSLESRDNFLRT